MKKASLLRDVLAYIKRRFPLITAARWSKRQDAQKGLHRCKAIGPEIENAVRSVGHADCSAAFAHHQPLSSYR